MGEQSVEQEERRLASAPMAWYESNSCWVRFCYNLLFRTAMNKSSWFRQNFHIYIFGLVSLLYFS